MLGLRLSEVCMKVVRGLDAMYDAGGHEEGEGQHKADLVAQLCLTFCHLVMMADASDLQEIDCALQEHSPETLVSSLDAAMIRISPEKGSVIVNTASRMKEVLAPNKHKSQTSDESSQDLYAIFNNLNPVSVGLISY